MGWVAWLSVYIAYALLLTFLYSGLGLQAHALDTPIGPEELTNLVKLIVNSFFLVAVVNWSKDTYTPTLRRHLDLMLHCTFALILLQLIVYIEHSGFDKIGSSESSNAAGYLYDPALCFWGVPEKNVFGAKIALFGFIYLFNYYIWEHRLPIWRAVIVFLCAFLSNSRTPMAALFIGIIYVLFRHLRIGGRVVLSLCVTAILPFILGRLLRVDNFLDPDDGMGVRIVYWSTFFSRFSDVSIFGRGFMSAGKFLATYSPIYLGEPQIHNLFLNNYLDFGIFGSLSYVLFLVFFYRFCQRDSAVWASWYWTGAFLPLLAIMLTLSTGYDSDTAVYLSAIYIIGHCASRKTSRLGTEIST